MDPTPRSATLVPSSSDLDPQPEGVEPAPDTPSAEPSAQPSPPRGPDPENTVPDQFEEGGGLDGQAGDADGGRAGVAGVAGVSWSCSGRWPPSRCTANRRCAVRWPAPTPTRGATCWPSMRRVLATADHLGVGRRRDQTITELALQWADQGLVDPDDAARFARLCSSAAFAGPGTADLDAEDAATMRELEHRLVAGLHGAVDRRQRLTAPWRNATDARRRAGPLTPGPAGLTRRTARTTGAQVGVRVPRATRPGGHGGVAARARRRRRPRTSGPSPRTRRRCGARARAGRGSRARTRRVPAHSRRAPAGTPGPTRARDEPGVLVLELSLDLSEDAFLVFRQGHGVMLHQGRRVPRA